MVRQGALGEITHAEGAYIHDLRRHYFADETEGGYHNNWIKLYSQQHTGNPYPTHGLGPICQWMDIHRGDRMEYLVSMSSREAGPTVPVAGKPLLLQGATGSNLKVGSMRRRALRTMIPNSN